MTSREILENPVCDRCIYAQNLRRGDKIKLFCENPNPSFVSRIKGMEIDPDKPLKKILEGARLTVERDQMIRSGQYCYKPVPFDPNQGERVSRRKAKHAIWG